MANEKDKSKDQKGFAELLDDVKVITSDRVVHKTPKPRPVPQQSNLDKERVLEELSVSFIEDEDMQIGDILSYVQPGVQNQVFRKLKRGQYSIEAELDLHGSTKIEAQNQLNEFIADVRNQGIRCVRIIHGKGYGSSNKGPVIKPLVNRWLQQRSEILAFCSARPVDGGTGAVYVLIKLI
ncbi:MAG: Smr/MutS family protein [Pseudomonadota bacterium]